MILAWRGSPSMKSTTSPVPALTEAIRFLAGALKAALADANMEVARRSYTAVRSSSRDSNDS